MPNMSLSPSCYSLQTIIPFITTTLVLFLNIKESNQLNREFWPKYWESDVTKGNFTKNSSYSLNLETALSNLSTLSNSHIFSNITVGSDDDNKVYALYECRKDVTLQRCHGCVEDATLNAVDLCYAFVHPKECIVIYEECMLRYANRMIFSKMELLPNYTTCAGVKLLMDRGALHGEVESNLESLIERAILETSSSTKYFGVEKAENVVGRDLYFLVQCAADISRTQCKMCLMNAFNFTVESCARDARLWGQFRGPSCQMRYDNDPFFNVSLLIDHNVIAPTPFAPDVSAQPLVLVGNFSFFFLMLIIFSIL